MPDETVNPESSAEEANLTKEPGGPQPVLSLSKDPAVEDVGSSPAEDSQAVSELAAPEQRFTLEPKPIPPAPEPRRPTAQEKQEKDKEEASQSPFSVTVGQVYDGPLDLLLDLIRKQNIDIYDIPIARITSQFLEYTHHLKQVDVDAAGEFIYVASLLIHIKSKTLLPRHPTDVAGGASEDPRRARVERLLEHERFKAAAQMLLQKQQIEEATWTNPGMKNFRRDTQETGGDELDLEQGIAADAVDLVRVFQDMLLRLRERPGLDV